ncbi:ImmA/IrrE family metallo-endopeptidase [Bacillus atrophaeus]|uniref:ImmA/IrrE family metallo-endopeptidase n=1 Tax=Bacillus atrophaeus TaxID=1452 RepID=UPI0022831E9B|nr:ImmA/IrrE family metallo-endopeptidase [Bacillus atrophaeus]MCY7948714.1 ImmA/IrrE family metallo-endopeptidase [Bacillus atrophaeus]MCY8971485.1 ImmA/IrrE family metallo-endopeptidase [Bacillus atrophaeus]MCY9168113.1 ImmA/IrrE family metallo-endopeptidase [Bacillus atrophaeus]MEC0742053.1 ImmA/IrrE family metallo-endopeptidase [Bacillus atrophaeus]MEC0744633.1 ImmA/IrrE family metallo-endopeptidase [Bacillus atrophaeus]
MVYDHLLVEASRNRIEVIERFMPSRLKGLYSSGIIWINKKQSLIEKGCTIAEELGHHFTSYGDILDLKELESRKQEKRARNWAYKKLVPLTKIIEAQKAGIRSRYELAEFLNVTEHFLEEALKRYIEEYGLYKELNGLTVCFQPLGVIEMFEEF